VPFCNSSEIFDRSVVDLCNSLDVASNRSLDNKGELCESISFGISGTGTSAKIDFSQASRSFLPRPESGCGQLPAVDKECRIIDAGAN
jgi:hypothetical protein